ncbi:DUF222 domain-containing protein [Mycobacterium sp. AMU20-3851]|uniref:DUF222 domain-containing protein n=1 Tax=Mycobacterium sp. AMU20-3851 TaxID=3122055 RepID=UPI003754A90B
MFDGSGAVTHLDSARDQLRAERAAVAHKLVAAGKFALARMAELGYSFDDLIVDDWELAAAELGAELGISRGRACTQMTHGRDLLQRLPEFAKVFLTGAVDFRVFLMISRRTALITDPDILSVIDGQVAERAPSWNALSDERIADLIDWLVIEVDPDAVRRARESRRNRQITVEPVGDGMVEIHGRVDALKGAFFDQRLDALARTTCPDDSRTFDQRRADAVEPLAAGAAVLACECGNENCPAPGNEAPTGQIVIHMHADRATVTGEQPVADPASRPALLPGYGTVPAEQVRDLMPRSVVQPVPEGGELGTESGYRPSKKLTGFIRCRDLTCRWPGCNVPAERCDVDREDKGVTRGDGLARISIDADRLSLCGSVGRRRGWRRKRHRRDGGDLIGACGNKPPISVLSNRQRR